MKGRGNGREKRGSERKRKWKRRREGVKGREIVANIQDRNENGNGNRKS